jgi:thiamine transport system substrate-binding protein
MNRARLRTVLTVSTAALVLSSCSLMGSEGESGDKAKGGDAGSTTEVVIVAHESFNLSKKLIRQFEKDSGYELTIRAGGDTGQLASKLSLTADNPDADVAFGIDNTFASRLLDAGAFAVNEPANPGADEFQLAEGSDRLTAIDHGSVCVNVDKEWFAESDLKQPTSLDDLTKPAYKGLFVVPGASTSSPGMAFLIASVAEYGDDWEAWWEDLMANDAKIVDGWTDAYYGDFTGASDKGKRPIVVSYDSSPAFSVPEDQPDVTTTQALLDTCFRQVEYAGVLEGADNPEGAKALIDFLLTDEVQAQIPDLMYMYPVVDGIELPAEWATFAPRAETPYEMSPEDIAANREAWLTDWTEIITR